MTEDGNAGTSTSGKKAASDTPSSTETRACLALPTHPYPRDL
jgi:hypothetical protein